MLALFLAPFVMPEKPVDLPAIVRSFPMPVRRVVEDLVAGNRRYVKGRLLHGARDLVRRDEVALGQQPDTIVLGCSDSRVPPEIVFDHGLGHMFIVRTAGEAIDFTAIASIEYAVAHFHPKVMLVLGHDYCGAIDATLKTPEGKSAGSPDLDRLVASLRPNLAGLKREDPALVKPAKANVNAIFRELEGRSEIVRKAVKARQMVTLHGLYRLRAGTVDLW